MPGAADFLIAVFLAAFVFGMTFSTVEGVTSKKMASHVSGSHFKPSWVIVPACRSEMPFLCEKKIPLLPDLTVRIERMYGPVPCIVVTAIYGDGRVKRTVGKFERGDLTPHVFDMIVSPAERLCLMTLPKGTNPMKVQEILKLPVWQEIVDEVSVRFLMEE
jgi:hypothetical protein